MRRVGAAAPAAEFTAVVAEALRRTQSVSDEEIRRRFDTTRGYEDFCLLLRQAGAPHGARILAIGCAEGMGRRAAYAAGVTRRHYAGAEVEELNWGDNGPPENGEEPEEGRFDLVVTHSFLHYLPDFGPACERIGEMLKPGGGYVMASEPNVRFWRNPECVGEMERVGTAESRRRRLLKLLNPMCYMAKARRILQGRDDGDPFADAGRMVRERMGLRADLTAREIADILEPHRYGLSWAELKAGPFSGMRLERVRTSGYVKRDNPARVPARWQELDTRLAARYPLDGCMFSALWRKP